MADAVLVIGANTKEVQTNLKKAGISIEKVGKKVKSQKNILQSFKKHWIGITAAMVGTVLIIKKVIGAAGKFEQLNIAFETFVGGKEKATALINELDRFAARTPFLTDQVNNAAKSLLAFGFEAEEIVPTLKMLGDISAGTGKDLGELGIIFGQIRGAGRLMGQDLLQLINAGFNPLQVISKKTGRSIRDLKDDMSKGAISFDMVTQAFKDATSEGGRFYNLTEKQSKSFLGRLSTLQSNIDVFARNVGNKLLPLVSPFVDKLNEIVTTQTDIEKSTKDLIKINEDYIEALEILEKPLGKITKLEKERAQALINLVKSKVYNNLIILNDRYVKIQKEITDNLTKQVGRHRSVNEALSLVRESRLKLVESLKKENKWLDDNRIKQEKLKKEIEDFKIKHADLIKLREEKGIRLPNKLIELEKKLNNTIERGDIIGRRVLKLKEEGEKLDTTKTRILDRNNKLIKEQSEIEKVIIELYKQKKIDDRDLIILNDALNIIVTKGIKIKDNGIKKIKKLTKEEKELIKIKKEAIALGIDEKKLIGLTIKEIQKLIDTLKKTKDIKTSWFKLGDDLKKISKEIAKAFEGDMSGLVEMMKGSIDDIGYVFTVFGDQIENDFGDMLTNIGEFISALKDGAIGIFKFVVNKINEIKEAQKKATEDMIDLQQKLASQRLINLENELKNEKRIALESFEIEEKKALDSLALLEETIARKYLLTAENYDNMSQSAKDYYDLIKLKSDEAYAAMTEDEQNEYDIKKLYLDEKAAAEKDLADQKLLIEQKLVDDRLAIETAYNEKLKKVKIAQFNIDKKMAVMQVKIMQAEALANLEKSFGIITDAEEDTAYRKMAGEYDNLIATIEEQIPAFQKGGNFTVPPGYENDTFPMRVNSGERVQVTPANQISNDYGLVYNIYNPTIMANNPQQFGNELTKLANLTGTKALRR